MTHLKSNLVLQYVVVLCCVGALYVISCAPGALWQDSGLIQYRIWHNDIEGFLGLAISHPLFYILGIGVKYISVGEFGHRVNLISSIAGAVAVANLFLFLRLLLGRNFPAVVAAITFAVSHTFWRHASIIETYTLWTAFFTTELIMLLQYTRTKKNFYLYWLGLFNGLSISVHMLSLLALLCYAFFCIYMLTKKEIRTGVLLRIVLFWIVGALPYEYLIIKNILQSGDVTGTLSSSLFGSRWMSEVLNTTLSAKIIKENFSFILLNFPTPNILLFFVGCFGLYKIVPRAGLGNVILGLTVLFFVFAFRYTIVDRYAFFIPFYCMVSIYIGLGVNSLQEKIRRKLFSYSVLILSFTPVVVYAAAPAMAAEVGVNISTRSDVPYRDDSKYFLVPWKTGYRGAERFATEALEAVEDDAIICADSTTAAPLLYVQEVKSIRPDVKIIWGIISSKGAPEFNEKTIRQLLEERAVYVTSKKAGYCPKFILDNYKLVEKGLLWKVIKANKFKN